MVWGIVLKWNRNSIAYILQKYLIIFIVLVIGILWIFEVVFLDSFYRFIRQNEIKNIAYRIDKDYDLNDTKDIVQVALDYNVYIVAIDSARGVFIYRNEGFNLMGILDEIDYPHYYNSLKNNEGMYLTNQGLNIGGEANDKVAYFLRGNNGDIIVVYTTLIPSDSMTQTIKIMIGIISGLLLVISFVISRIMNHKISKPIINLSEETRELKDNIESREFITKGYEEINTLTKTLNEMRKSVLKIDELKNELIGNVSHDLKTPLTMIGGYAEMMKDIPEEITEENLDVIIDETKYLTNMVNDLLDLSAIQSNMKELNLETIKVNDVIEPVIYRLLNTYPNRKITYKGIESDINVDKKLFYQVIYNLINNACIHTNSDIDVDVIDVDKSLLIKVIDYGEGIEKELLPKIWYRYQSTNMDYKRTGSGTGIGLSIVKRILDAHKFEYGVESEIGKGTTFWIKVDK